PSRPATGITSTRSDECQADPNFGIKARTTPLVEMCTGLGRRQDPLFRQRIVRAADPTTVAYKRHRLQRSAYDRHPIEPIPAGIANGSSRPGRLSVPCPLGKRSLAVVKAGSGGAPRSRLYYAPARYPLPS